MGDGLREGRGGGAVRNVGLQRVTEEIEGKLKYLAERLKEKYGMEAERGRDGG